MFVPSLSWQPPDRFDARLAPKSGVFFAPMQNWLHSASLPHAAVPSTLRRARERKRKVPGIKEQKRREQFQKLKNGSSANMK
jgi:hypothetical protein